MPFSNGGPEWSMLINSLLAVLWGVLGRLLDHATKVQRGGRAFWSRALLWELPVAIAMGLVGDGLAAHLGLADQVRVGFTVAVAYLGPKVIEVGFAWAMKKLGITKQDLENTP